MQAHSPDAIDDKARMTPTGAILAIPVPGDPGGASGPEKILLVEEYVLQRVFDGRQSCRFVLRAQAGDLLPEILFRDCPAYAEATPGGSDGTCRIAGYDRPEEAGRRRCAFHVAVDDPADDVWAKARDWKLRMVPDLDRRGNVVPGRFVEAACYRPREEVSCLSEPASLSSSD